MSDWTRAYAGRRAVVLGASGFIGRWVARALADRGAQVVAVGRARAGMESALRQAGAAGDMVARDLTRSGLRTWLARLKPDVVFNLAGYGVDPAERDRGRAERLNHQLVAELAEAMSSLGNPDWPHVRLVHTGSALEYGSTGGVLREDSPTTTTTLYGETKLAGTTAFVERALAGGMRAIVARLFTVYGPGERAGRLLPTLLAAAASGSDVELSEGVQRRDFAYVEDVAEGLLRLAVSGAAPGDVVNLATGVMQSVRDFVQTSAHVANIARDRLLFGALATRPEEMSHAGVSVERLVTLTGWKPSDDLESGVRRTLARLQGGAR